MSRHTVAYVAPFGVFVLFLVLAGALEAVHIAPGGLPAPYSVYPLQTAVCAGVLIWFWRNYDFGKWRRAWLAAAIGLLVFAIWIAPQWLFHHAPRASAGFNPSLLAPRPALYWTELAFRFLRLVLVVPALEEIFWRGYLLRALIREDFLRVPFGSYSRLANGAVALGFMVEHTSADWPAALLAGLLYNLVAYDTRSLRCCILAHALTNALLGVYIMTTRQWGFW